MQSTQRLILPVHRLLMVLVFCLLGCALAIFLALQTPWLGLVLQGQDDGSIKVLNSSGSASAIPAGSRLVFIEAAGTRFMPTKDDLLEEPDVVNDYVEMDAFFQRQGQMAALLRSPEVKLGWQGPGQTGEAVNVATLSPQDRPLHSLPMPFWFQLAVSCVGCLIAAWVWALRPAEWGVRLFAITGASFPVFALPAAIYSSRELALDGSWFKALSALNHWGSFMFGAALISIFLYSPRHLVARRWVAVPFVFYSLWWLAETLRLAPDLDWGNRYAVMSEMALALLLAVVQWVRSKGKPVDRAALLWFMLSLLVGSGLFILLIVTTVSLGWLPPLPQGYAFGFFLFIYIGIALGLGRYRLFELDVWAYRLLVWLGGALAIIGLDAVFVLVLHWSGTQALAASIWACTLVYLPLRRWIWTRFTSQNTMQLHDLLPDVVRIAFQPLPHVRERLWDGLLGRLFQPLEQNTITPQQPSVSPDAAQIEEDGLTLLVPACAGIGPRKLRYPAQGARLFTPRDRSFVDALSQLMTQAETSRAAQEHGATQERQRISRDMHDDVGARLLMLIHHAKTPAIAELARMAMQDLRTALGSLDTLPVLLGNALADWRAEASDRCEAAGVTLFWSAPPADTQRWLSSRQKAVLERCIRESITNALKHAHPTELHLQAQLQADELTLQISHDGPESAPDTWVQGRGLRGMQHRLQDAHGTLTLVGRAGGGIQTTIRLQLDKEDGDD